jgi:8-oxo-dGTP pyrophosphatase MutT (NUDIX family)
MLIEFDQIAQLLAQHQFMEPPGTPPINAAVAMILRQTREDMEVLFIERTSDERDPWSGNLAFPGGRVELGEEPRQTAERETLEEIGLDLVTACYLGWLGNITGSRLPVQVSCFVYAIDGEETTTVLNKEVYDLFWVGLDDLMAAERNIVSPVRFEDKELDVPAIRLPKPGKPVLWGLTYRLVMLFRELIPKI